VEKQNKTCYNLSHQAQRIVDIILNDKTIERAFYEPFNILFIYCYFIP